MLASEWISYHGTIRSGIISLVNLLCYLIFDICICRLSKNHGRKVVKCRAHTSDAKADKNHWCSVETQG